jgi:glucose/arabinose dehydrogenase
MSRGIPLSRRLVRVASVLGLLIAGVAPFLADQPVVSAQQGPVLLVDDAETTNPELVEVAVADPLGFGFSGKTLRVPPGYSVSVVGGGLGGPRFMDFDGEDNLIVGAARQGVVYRFPFLEADGQLGEPEVLISRLEQPASVVIFSADDGKYLYVGEETQVSRFPYVPAGPIGAQEVVIPNLPARGHRTRTVAFGPDGMLYLAVGSSCNICLEQEPIRATISRANSDGSDLEIFATGMRNPVGLAFQPETDLLWATVNERDNQGNEIPPDLVTIVEEGADYGWPGCIPPDAKPQEAESECFGTTPPTVGIQAHSAPLGLAFLEGEEIPDIVNGDLIVAQHGSWNREPPAAPKLLLIDFEDGVPVAARDFVTGWQDASGERWGRPAGVVVAPDGSLIVSDDSSNLLYRISAEG